MDASANIIVEARRDLSTQWSYVRVRNDKFHANHVTTLKGVIQSMQDAIDEETVRPRRYIVD